MLPQAKTHYLDRLRNDLTLAHPFNTDINFWYWIVKRKGFLGELKKNGYYQIDKNHITREYRKHLLKYHQSNLGAQVPSFFIDRFESLPTILAQNNLFLVPIGRHGCIIFDRRVFPDAYIHIKKHTSDMKIHKLAIKQARPKLDRVSSKTNPYKNFSSRHWNEQSFIRFLHYNGAFSALVKNICRGNGAYSLGPAGHANSSFFFWMKDRKGRLIQFAFDGICDLDECIFVSHSDTIFVVEGKLCSPHDYDLAWYKLAFPSYWFIPEIQLPWYNNSLNRSSKKLRIIPVYATYDNLSSRAYLYVFPRLSLHKGKAGFFPRTINGVILNDEPQFTPTKIFEIDLQ